jgi:predicted ArsR family transcriptional regulator
MDPLEAVGDRELRATFSFVLAHARPVTADDLAVAQRSHRNVARSRLERLADAGLLIRGAERRTGRVGPGAGRPAKTYAVAPQLRAIEFPDRRYEKLVRLVADSLPAESRRERLRTVGVAFAQELLRALRPRPAKTLADGAERVCAALRTLGFHASVAEVGDGNVVIETAACPLRPLVRESPAIADVDRGMWIGLAEWAFDGVDAEQVGCGTDRCLGDGSCRVTLTVAETPS